MIFGTSNVPRTGNLSSMLVGDGDKKSKEDEIDSEVVEVMNPLNILDAAENNERQNRCRSIFILDEEIKIDKKFQKRV